MRKFRTLLSLMAGVLLVGCITPERVAMCDVQPAGWEERVEVRYANSDTTALCELRVVLRLEERFVADSLTLRITTLSPDSLRASEYHRLHLPVSRVAAPLHRVVEVPYRRGVQLQRAGEYRFALTPTRPIEGVEAVGMKIITES